MNQKSKRRIGILLGVLFIGAIVLMAKLEGLRRVDSDYGWVFNIERSRLGLPLIETYFVPRYREGDGIQIWMTPDSARGPHIHIGKNYWVMDGKINNEIDYFVINLDSEIHELERRYQFVNDSVSYTLTVRNKDEIVLLDTLNRSAGDSLLTQWLDKTD